MTSSEGTVVTRHMLPATRLDPTARRQLSEDGIIVFWRDDVESGAREGLLCSLAPSSQSESGRGAVEVFAYVVDERAAEVIRDANGLRLVAAGGKTVRLVQASAQLRATVEPSSGDTRAGSATDDSAESRLLRWLRLEMDGEALDLLHRFEARAMGRPPEGPRVEIDLDEVDSSELVWVEELLQGTRCDEFVLDGRRYWAAVYLCPAPWCDCHDAEVVFFDDADESDDMVGLVTLDISGSTGVQVHQLIVESAERGLLEALWGLFERRHDVGSHLRRREAQVKAIGATL